MNKKLICILLSGIFLVTMFSMIDNICKAEYLSEKSQIEDIFYGDKIEQESVPFISWHLIIYFGDFYVEGDHVKGHANVMFHFYIPIPIPFIRFNQDVNIDINDSNYDFYKCRHNEYIVTVLYWGF